MSSGISGGEPQRAAAPPERTRRLFFALWPDAAQRAALVHAVRKAVRGCGGRPVPAESLHVTLAFLGSVPESRIAELGAVAHAAAARAPQVSPLALTLGRIGYAARAQILWVLADREANAVPGLAALAGALREATEAAGFCPDLKPFRLHVTVARKVTHAPSPQAMRPVEWRFDGFALIESRTDPAGALYSVVESYALFGAEKVRT
ncbi:MAG TPA: RNA 2',3'-cyclic phosphodiesterase [Steroidobacteraceae bacterium]|nr:RNA 2',3'-cyclic phosphodiesterase [Steroidobacteraceae bacterium]